MDSPLANFLHRQRRRFAAIRALAQVAHDLEADTIAALAAEALRDIDVAEAELAQEYSALFAERGTGADSAQVH